jgi:Domain of Unknown Function (DUF1080)
MITRRIAVAAALALCAAARQGMAQATGASANPAPNTLTAAERAAGWRLLFDGHSFAGWRGLGYDSVPTAHWTIENGAIKKIANERVAKGADGKRIPGGDLMTDSTFGDFELSWDWKMTPAGNSGVKYNVSEELSGGQPSNVLRPATGSAGVSHSAIGFEYQMIDDDRHSDGKLPTHRSGALYDMLVPSADKRLAPVGEWNHSRIVFVGNHGEHWLNGVKVVEYDLGTPRVDSAFAHSKFHTMPWYPQRRTGHIVLQDHGDEVYFRNIKIKAKQP